MPPIKTFIISGMHRSGTSLVASVLQSSGIHIGDALLGSNESNAYGHYEDVDFLNFHQSVLGEDNKDGFKLVSSPHVDQDHAELSKQLISARENYPHWGWKDPRTVLFLDFWQQQLKSPFTVLVYRHPIEVIISLIRRSTDWELIKNPRKAISLWLLYNQKVLQFKQANPATCLLCDLSAITHNFDGFVELLSSKTGVELSTDKAKSSFRPEELNQFDWPEKFKELNIPLINECLDLYAKLEGQADLPSFTEHLSKMDIPWSSFDKIAKSTGDKHKEAASSLSFLISNILAPNLTQKFFLTSDAIITAQTTELENRKNVIIERINDVKRLNEHNSDLELKGKSFKISAIESNKKVKLYEDELIDSQQKLAELNSLLEERNREIEHQNTTISSQGVEIESHRAVIEKSKSVIKQQTQDLKVTESLKIKVNDHIQEAKRSESVIQEQLKELRTKSLELTDLIRLGNEKDSTISNNESDLGELKDIVQARDEALASYEAELSLQKSELKRFSKKWILSKTQDNKASQHFWLNLAQKSLAKFHHLFAILSRPFGGYKPHPLFDPEWYKSQSSFSRLVYRFPYIHYSLFGWREGRNPNPYFNVIWYLGQNPDVLEADEEPLQHYMAKGWLEDRNPSDRFSTSQYLSEFPKLLEQNINPLVHYISRLENYEDNSYSVEYKKNAKARTEYETPKPTKESQIAQPSNVSPIDLYQEERKPAFQKLPAKIIAFYLPQFHPIPENDQFWGKGFTEWRNVTKAKPQFKGHHQPNLPGSLGFYDLRLPDVMERQAELARQYGISGFCFHFYWFNGRRVLERPVEQLLANPKIDIEFCLNWANENWTRSWDGKSKEVLIEQNHTPEDDIDFIKEAMRFFSDPRYINVDSKPVLMVYNPTLLPDAAATAKRWREYCKKTGFDIFLLVAETHGFDSKNETWFDGLVEFPPLRRLPENVTAQYDCAKNFGGSIFKYADLAKIHSEPQNSKHPIFKTVSPGWDNTARRDDKATIFAGATPELYKQWLANSIEHTIIKSEPSQRILFVNAWNEWAEGAYLEPDSINGYAYLNATAETLKQFDSDQETLIFTSHDTNLGGAQNLILTLLRWMKVHTKLRIKILASSGGALKNQFEALYPTYIIDKESADIKPRLHDEIQRFCGNNVVAIFMNTVVSADLLTFIESIDAPKILYAHELKKSIEKFYGHKKFTDAAPHYDAYIGGSQPVIENLIKSYGIPRGMTSVIESFIPIQTFNLDEPKTGKDDIRASLDISLTDTIVIGCGMIEWRKGPDLFTQVAREGKASGLQKIKFIWIGPIPEDTKQIDEYRKGVKDIVEFVGVKTNFKEYFQAADIFLLPSREDPFPLVCLEAADSGLPIITFAENGGSPKFVSEAKCGYVVPFEDTSAMSCRLRELIEDPKLLRALGNNGRQAVQENYSDHSAGPRVLQSIRNVSNLKPKVSIIVPAYNHAIFLEQRLDSIYAQTFQDFEVILLDDASTDDTPSILSNYQKRANTSCYLNDENTASPFKQWTKGINLAKADIIWIAEDDDFCDPYFLEEMLPSFDSPDVVLAYSQSEAVNQHSEVQFSYMDYYRHEFEDHQRWLSPFTQSGFEEIHNGLALINTIPNASAVLFRKFDITEWEQKWGDKKLAGDWAFYIYALKQGKVAFNPKHLNFHRRHANTMTNTTKAAKTRFTEVSEVHRDVLNLFDVSEKTKLNMRIKMKDIWTDVTENKSDEKFNAAYDKIIEG